MKTSRIILAGVLAGLTVFIWGMLSHMVLGIGQMGVKVLPNESAILAVLQQNVNKPGFYIFPGNMAAVENAPKDQQDRLMKEYEETFKTMPHGVMAIKPADGTFYSFPKLLAGELISNILGGLIVAWMLAFAVRSLPSFLSRVLFVAAAGLFAVAAIDVSYWNWYDFPAQYLVGSLLDNGIGWALAGVTLALLLKPNPATAV